MQNEKYSQMVNDHPYFFGPLSHFPLFGSATEECPLSLDHRPTQACRLRDNTQVNVGPLSPLNANHIFTTRQLVMTIVVKVINPTHYTLIALCL